MSAPNAPGERHIADDVVAQRLKDAGKLGPHYPVRPAEYVLPAAMQKWVRQYDWAYSTTAECYGHEPSENDVYNWCVFDADEDDPPLFEVATVDDAQMLVYVMRWLQQRLIDGSPDAG